METTGKELGGEIDINLTRCKAIAARLRKARQSCQTTRKELFTNMALKIRTNHLLRNAIARSTLTYGIQTLQLAEQEKQRLNGFTFYCMRMIQYIYWSRKPQKPQSKNLRITTRHPTTTSWFQKLKLKHALAQTRTHWNIHSRKIPLIIINRKTWHGEWQGQKTKMAQLQEQNKECTNNKALGAKEKEITGDHPRGEETGLTVIKNY